VPYSDGQFVCAAWCARRCSGDEFEVAGLQSNADVKAWLGKLCTAVGMSENCPKYRFIPKREKKTGVIVRHGQEVYIGTPRKPGAASMPGTAYVLFHRVMGGTNGKRGVWAYVRCSMGGLTQALSVGTLLLKR
jgi:hypothetical protein